MKPSQSLEGLEQVIPPTSPLALSSPLSPVGRPYYLQLDKPLPEKPLPDTPSSMGCSDSMVWSNSNEASTLDSGSQYSGRESSRYSSDSYPIIVRTGSEYGVERPYSDASSGVGVEIGVGDIRKGELLSPIVPAPLATRHSPSQLDAFLASDNEENAMVRDLEDLEKWNDNDDYNDHHLDARWSQIRHAATDFTQGRNDNSHYFREKKWDFFPELAPVAGLSKRPCRQTSAVQAKKRNTPAFDFRRARANTFTGAPTALASNVRDSIRFVVQKTMKSSLEKEKEKRRRQPRPSTAKRAAAASVNDFSDSSTGSSSKSKSKQQPERSDYLSAITKPQPPYEEKVSIATRLRSLSMSTGSSGAKGSPRPAPPHHGPAYPKQLAVPLSPYQKYGAAIFDKPSTPSTPASTQSHNRFYQGQNRARRWSLSNATSSYIYTSSYITNNSSMPNINLTATQSYPELPTSPPLRSQLQRGTKALHDGTSYMRDALDGAKRRVVDARVDRRRAQLKAQIRLIGPVNPYTTYGRVDPWDCI